MVKTALILDTNIYLNFLKYNEKDEHNFYKLLLMRYIEYDLFIVDIIKEEWENNKGNVIEEKKRRIEQIRKELSNDKSMSAILESVNKEIDESIKLMNRIINAEYLTRRMEFLNDFINNAKVINHNNYDVYKNVINKSMNKEAPFFNNGSKNEIKDALIWGSIIEYFKNDTYYDEVIFVTENSNDFAEKNNSNKLHEKLEKEAFSKLKFTNNIKGLIQQKNGGGHYDSIEQLIDTQNELKYNYDDKFYIKCKNCKEELHEKINLVTKARNLHYKCPHCFHTEDTGVDSHEASIADYY